MGVTYQKNPVSLIAVNPGKPPKTKTRKKSAKGGSTVAKRKSTRKAKRSPAQKAATKRMLAANKKARALRNPAKKAKKTKLGVGPKVPKTVAAALKSSAVAVKAATKAAKNASVAATKASKAAVEAANSTKKTIKMSRPPKMTAAQKKAKAKAATKKRKAAAKKPAAKKKTGVTKIVRKAGRRPMYFVKGKLAKASAYYRAVGKPMPASAKKTVIKKAAAPKKRKTAAKKAPAKRKSAASKKRTPAQKAATRKLVALNKKRAKGSTRKSSAISRRAPKRPPTARSKPIYTGPKRAGKRRQGYYPIKGYTTQPRWQFYKNPGGAGIMPNGTILDPVTKKFVSPTGARGRQLLGRNRGSYLSNPGGMLSRLYQMPIVETAKTAGQQVLGLSAGFFGARALANAASMSSMIPVKVAPYAPFLAQITSGVLVYALGEKIDVLRPYQVSAMAGVGLSLVEAIVNRFMPASVQEYVAVPEAGLGDDLLSYRRALSGYEGLNEGWADYYPGDEVMLNAMGEYILPENLDPTFDVDPMGEYVLDEDLDAEFDVGGGMGEYVLTEDIDPEFEAIGDYAAQEEALYQVGMGDVFSDRARNQIGGMGEFVSVDELDDDFDFYGGMGDDTQSPVISSVHGPAVGGGMFGTTRSNKYNSAVSIAAAAIQAAKATGANPRAAAAAAMQAVMAGVKIPKSRARRAVLKAMRSTFRGAAVQTVAPAPVAPAAVAPASAPVVPEMIEPEEDEEDFRTGIFSDGMFDPSDD